jgi:hypothetical protein
MNVRENVKRRVSIFGLQEGRWWARNGLEMLTVVSVRWVVGAGFG